MSKRYFVISILLLYLVFCFMFENSEAGKAGKIAKAVLKASVMKNAMGHKSHMGRRSFPTWAIVLLVLGSSSCVGLIIFLLCLWKSRRCLTPWSGAAV